MLTRLSVGRGPTLPAGKVGRVLVRPVDRGVHADAPVDLTCGVGVGEQCGEDLVPGPVAAEAAVPPPHRLPRTERRRQVPPGDAAPVAVDHALDHLTVITHRPALAGTLRRQQRLDQVPLTIIEQGFTVHTITLLDDTSKSLKTRPRSVPARRAAPLAGRLRPLVRTG